MHTKAQDTSKELSEENQNACIEMQADIIEKDFINSIRTIQNPNSLSWTALEQLIIEAILKGNPLDKNLFNELQNETKLIMCNTALYNDPRFVQGRIYATMSFLTQYNNLIQTQSLDTCACENMREYEDIVLMIDGEGSTVNHICAELNLPRNEVIREIATLMAHRVAMRVVNGMQIIIRLTNHGKELLEEIQNHG